MLRRAFFALIVACCLATMASAGPMIIAGDHPLAPNTPGQQILIMAAGGDGDAFEGVDLHLSIGGGIAGPIATAIDVVGPGTLLFGNNFGQADYGDLPSALPSRTPTALASVMDGKVGPNGVLAIVTLDTTGIPLGTYSFSLTHPFFGPSDLPPFNTMNEAPLNMTLVNGTLTIVPEPATMVLGLMAAMVLGGIAIRRRPAR